MLKTFHPVDYLSGSIRVPGDKSISHRAAMLAAMSKGASHLHGMAPGHDVVSTLRCLRELGFVVETHHGPTTVGGDGWFPRLRAELDCGNSGTTMRLLSGALSSVRGHHDLAGDVSLSRRPMDRIAKPLRLMGANVSLTQERYPPIVIEGTQLRPIEYTSEVASSQVKSAVLLAALYADGETAFAEPAETRDHTERMLAWLGAGVSKTALTVKLRGEPEREPFEAFELAIPGDFSSASFFIAAALMLNGSGLTIEHVGLNPTRTAFLEAVREMGAEIEVEETGSAGPEPVGSIHVKRGPLVAKDLDKRLVAGCIDEVPLIALLASTAEGTTCIRNADELRVKESDRISAVVDGLQRLGVEAEELPDGLCVKGPARLKGATIDSFGDHRIALTFAVAACAADGPVTIEGWDAADVSFPGFDAALGKIAR